MQFPTYKMSPLVQKSGHTYWLTKPSHTQLIIKFTMRKQRPLKHLMPVADVGSVVKCKWDKNGCFNPSIWQWYLIYNFDIFHVENTFCLFNGSIHRFVMKITNVPIVILKTLVVKVNYTGAVTCHNCDYTIHCPELLATSHIEPSYSQTFSGEQRHTYLV